MADCINCKYAVLNFEEYYNRYTNPMHYTDAPTIIPAEEGE